MNKSVIESRNKVASTQTVSHLGLCESNWVVINVWSGQDPVLPRTPPNSPNTLQTPPKTP